MTIRSLEGLSVRTLGARTLKARIFAAICTLLALTVTATGCAIPQMGSYQTTIPEAVKALDPGVVSVMAYSSTDGFSRHVEVDVNLDRDTISIEELGSFLETIVPLVNQPGASRLEVSFFEDKGSPADTIADGDIDISESRAELFSRWNLTDHSGRYETYSVNEDLSTLRDKINEIKKQR